MPKLANLARVVTATVGTGTVTLGVAVSGYLTFAQAGLANGDQVWYSIKDDNGNSEVGTGTYSATGPTLSRDTVLRSTGAGNTAKIFLSGSAQVIATVLAETFAAVALSGSPSDLTTAGTVRGNLLYRASATWDFLAPGSNSGDTLTTGGSGADPVWSSHFNVNATRVNADVPYYSLGRSLAASDGISNSFNVFYDGSGLGSIALGGTAQNQNIYVNDQHNFYTRASVGLMQLTASSLAVQTVIESDGASAGFISFDRTNPSFYGGFYVTGGNTILVNSSFGNIFIFDTAGKCGVGVTPSYKFDVGGDCNLQSGSVYRIGGVLQPQWTTVPVHNTSAGTAGQMAYDGSYLYICTAANTWNRVAWTAGTW